MKTDLITDIYGQDGSCLAELLLCHVYKVHDVVPPDAIEDPEHRLVNIGHFINKIIIHVGCIDNHLFICKIVAKMLKADNKHIN